MQKFRSLVLLTFKKSTYRWCLSILTWFTCLSKSWNYLVHILIDSAASGIKTVGCEVIYIRQPAQFVLVGSGKPEMGEN